MKKTTSFFSALVGSCRGTEIFDDLCAQSVWRTLFHLLILSIFCAILTVGFGRGWIEKIIREPIEVFMEQTGGVDQSESGLRPRKSPDAMLSFLLDPKIKVIYLPDSNAISDQLLLKDGTLAIWLPEGIFFFAREPEKPVVYAFFYGFSHNLPSIVNLENAGEIKGWVNKNLDDLPDFDYEKLPLPTANDFVSTFVFLFFIIFSLQMFMQAVMLNLVFSLFYRFVGIGRMGSLTLRQLFVIGVYAGFPAMAVAWFFPGFELPLLRYELAYSIGWVIYLLFVLNRFERRKNTDDQSIQS